MTLTRLPILLLVAFVLIAAGCRAGAESPSATAPDGYSISTVTTVPGGTAVSTATSPSATAVARAATATPEPSSAVSPPVTGKWIDVDLTNFQVRLMQGETVVQTIHPVAVGEQINTGAYESTQTGLFYVYNKIGGLQYDAPYDAYISDWVAFDPDKDNGFHSFLLDEDGDVVDASTGRVSNGCIRTAAARAIFEFSEIGTPVYVHI